jgi:hypothetical protein
MSRAYWISDAKAIRLLGSPLRQAIIDRIVSGGPTSVAQLAGSLSRPADRLYYHIKLLVRAGLLVERAAIGGRVEAAYDVPGRPMLLDYGSTVGKQRRAVARVVDALMRSGQRDFRRSVSDKSLRVEGPLRELWSGRAEGLLSPADLAALNKHLQAAVMVLLRAEHAPASRPASQRSAPRKRYQLTWSLSPAGSPSQIE